MATFSPRQSLPAAHEYVRTPADMHPRLVRLTSVGAGPSLVRGRAGIGAADEIAHDSQ